MLAPLDLGPDDEQRYLALLAAPGSPVAAIARATGDSTARAQAGLARLVALGLARRRTGRPATFEPVPPDVAITALLDERQAGLDRARLAIPELLAAYRRGTASAEPNALVEVLSGPGAARRLREIQSVAAEEVLVLSGPGAGLAGGEVPALRRGVRRRGIYEVSSLSEPGRLRYLRRLARLGEQARVARRLPIWMVICDQRLALLPLAGAVPAQRVGGAPRQAGGPVESVALVNPSALLDALVELFEDYWQRSTPIWAAGQPPDRAGLTPAQREVLELLAAGLKDEAIARQLGISLRTARRRITSVLTHLGVSTRFQAGAEATRRGLL